MENDADVFQMLDAVQVPPCMASDDQSLVPFWFLVVSGAVAAC